MKIGLGLYRHMLTDDNFRFARQAGATDIVAHLTNYFAGGPRLPGQGEQGWGAATGEREIWSLEGLRSLRDAVAGHGLRLAALENFDPALWYDVLLAGPMRDEQIATIQQIIRDMGEVDIPVMGYNFSIAGVWGWKQGPFARGGAESVGLVPEDANKDSPIPNGTVWNMVYDPHAPEGFLEPVSHEELWARLRYFLDAVVPVAEKAGVILAAHPDDPPMPTLRGQARLVFQPRYYDQLFALHPSESNRAELCIGSVAEMTEGDLYEDVERWAAANKVGYVHMRNVIGKVPDYREVFIDEGSVDIPRVMQILARNGFEGVIIPDHTPQLHCGAPWHAGMAYAIGYMRANLQLIERGIRFN